MTARGATSTLGDLFGDPNGGPTGDPSERDHVMVVDGPDRWSASRLSATVDAAATRLADAGVGHGDIVLWQSPNTVEAVVAYRACWQLGAVAAPLHHLAGTAEVAEAVERLAPTVVLGGDELAELIVAPGRGTSPRPGPPGASPHDPAVILQTSGSGGRPKGVVHSHGALAAKARLMVDVHDLHAGDVVLMPAPLAHVSGLLNGILVPAAAGMRTVLMARWDPVTALELIESEQVSFMVGPPTFFIGLEAASGFSAERVDSLRLLSLGGAGVTPEFAAWAEAVLGAVAKRTYGSTEAPSVTTSLNGDDPDTRHGTEGRAVGDAAVRVVDPVTGRVCTEGEVGEIRVSGPELFVGYTDDAATAAAVVEEGGRRWFRTGDLGSLDEHGRLRVTGRLGDVIIRGGENIDPAEVEAHLVAHPAVRHAVVVGEPDERLGERVCAFVELEEGHDAFDLAEVSSWFTSRGVARFRTPERVVVLDTIPLLASGKADRAALAARSIP